jgi:hypothetical protein
MQVGISDWLLPSDRSVRIEPPTIFRASPVRQTDVGGALITRLTCGALTGRQLYSVCAGAVIGLRSALPNSLELQKAGRLVTRACDAALTAWPAADRSNNG